MTDKLIEENREELPYLQPTEFVEKEVNKLLKLLTSHEVDEDWEWWLDIKIRKGRQILEQYLMNKHLTESSENKVECPECKKNREDTIRAIQCNDY